MIQDIEAYRLGVLEAIANATTLEELEAIRVAALGRNGEINQAMKALWKKDHGQGTQVRKDDGPVQARCEGDTEAAR